MLFVTPNSLAKILATLAMGIAFQAFPDQPCEEVRFNSGHDVFCLELATTPPQWEAGLQYRHYLPERGGMLFVFPKDEPRVFWMKDTLLELDVLFIDDKGVLRTFLSRVPPSNIRVFGSARYVIELPAGSAEKMGIWPSAQIQLPEAMETSLPNQNR